MNLVMQTQHPSESTSDKTRGAPLVQARQLVKSFGTTRAVDGVAFELAPGHAVGLVGRNGSGKTTLLRLIAGLSVPDEGVCFTLGTRSSELGAAELQRLGFVDQDARLIPWMTGRQTLDYAAAMQPRWDRELERRLSAALELPLEQRVGAMSGGTRKRLALLLALGHRPALLLLDEPLAGVDPIQRKVVRELLLERQLEDGATLLTSSHDLSDIERGADRLLVLESGRLVVDESMDALKERFAEWIVTHPSRDLPSRFDENYVLSTEGGGRRMRLVVNASSSEREDFARRHGAVVESRSLDLEALFPLLTGAGRGGAR